MATIPEEYANFDFGFSAVDDEEYKAKTTEVEKKIVEVEAKSKDFSALEKKIKISAHSVHLKNQIYISFFAIFHIELIHHI